MLAKNSTRGFNTASKTQCIKCSVSSSFPIINPPIIKNLVSISPKLLIDSTNGDRKAQYQLYRTCFNVLMGVCMRYKKDQNEAAEVLNLGFLKILNNLDKYKVDTPFEAWIRRIMINTIIDEFRKNRKVKELIEYKDFTDTNEANNVSMKQSGLVDFNEADKQFDAEQLEGMIQSLPPMSRKVFNLFALDGYSHKEVSEMLGMSEGTSKWHLSSARKRIQEMMKKEMNTSKVV